MGKVSFKKIFLIIFANVIFLIFVGGIIECLSYFTIQKLWCSPNNRPFLDYRFILKKKPDVKKEIEQFSYSIKGDENKRPIVLLGCSYTAGFLLEENETFTANLNTYTGRSIYNYALGGASMATVLRQLQSEDFLKKLPKNPEYFIYTYIIDHNKRCYERAPGCENDILLDLYEVDGKNNLRKVPCENVCTFFCSTAMYRLWRMTLGQMVAKSGDFSLPDAIISEISNILKKEFPNSKFAIIVYDDNTDTIHLPLDYEEKMMSEIAQKNDIKILFTKKMTAGKDILDGKYRASDNVHPSGEAWKKLTPDIAKALNL